MLKIFDISKQQDNLAHNDIGAEGLNALPSFDFHNIVDIQVIKLIQVWEVVYLVATNTPTNSIFDCLYPNG